MNKIYILLLVSSLFLSGCATTSMYRGVFKEEALTHVKEYNVDKDILFISLIEVLCLRQFTIITDDEEKGVVLAKRVFLKDKKNYNLNIQGKLIRQNENKYLLSINTIETVEAVKGTQRVLEREKLINDAKFYEKLFSEIENSIKKRVK